MQGTTNRLSKRERGSQNGGISDALARGQMLRIGALSAAILCCLCTIIIVSSTKVLSNHLITLQEKGNEGAGKFVGIWVLTVGDVYDLKDSPLPAPFLNLPQGLARDLPLAEVVIRIDGGKIAGKRFLYSYAPGTPGGSPTIKKGEVDLVDIHAESSVLSGNSATLEGERLPGGWEMRLTNEKEVEVRVTGNEVPDEQKKLVLKLHRMPR